jgi:tRNA(Ile)-lysidine synthase
MCIRETSKYRVVKLNSINLNDYVLKELAHLPHPLKYWIAFSGGLDSTCLLHVVFNIRHHLSAPIVALHLNHGLQANSAHWVAHCQKICKKLDVTFVTLDLNVQVLRGDSLEAVARQARLLAYQQVMQKDDMILLAHHQNDQAETVLLQLLRGSGLPGLAAMPVLSNLATGWLARPFLNISRSQLLDYANYHQLTWIEDPSNAEIKFDRNYLRHKIFPELKSNWIACETTISRSARHCAEALQLLNELLQPHLQSAHGGYQNSLSKSKLLELSPELCRAILRYWIQMNGYSLPDTVHLERIRTEVLTAANDRNPLVAWRGVEIRRYRDDVFIMPPLPKLSQTNIMWLHTNETCQLPNGLGQLKLIQTNNELGIDADLWYKSTIEIRFGVNGETCRLPNTRYNHRMKYWYQTYAIPNWIRPYLPMIYANDKLIAVMGIGQCVPLVKDGVKIIWTKQPPAESRWV